MSAEKEKKKEKDKEKDKKPKEAGAKKNGTRKKSSGAKAAAKSAEAAGVPEVAEVLVVEISRPTYEQIAELAHSYYIERGGEHGYDEQDWFRAEQELLAAR